MRYGADPKCTLIFIERPAEGDDALAGGRSLCREPVHHGRVLRRANVPFVLK